MSLLNGFLGGTLVGGAAAVTLLGSGEIMGFSGIINAVLKSPLTTAREHPWKVAFLSTFMFSAYAFLIPNADAAKISAIASITSPMAYGLSGFLVRSFPRPEQNRRRCHPSSSTTLPSGTYSTFSHSSSATHSSSVVID